MSPQGDEAFRAEYEAATSGVGVVPLSGWSTLRIEGRDRVTFLHNMCTNDIRGLAVGGQCEAFLTDVKGKIVGHALVLAGEDDLMLVGVPGQAARLMAHLDRYIIREDVRLVDDSANVAWSLAVGRGAVAESPGVLVAAYDWIWPGGFWAGGSARPQASGSTVCGDGAWQALRVESGWPLYGVDFDESNLPQEVGRDAQAISFRKGCYLGQETIARIDALGHVNKRLATVRLSCKAAVGDELFAEGKSAGHVTSVSWSPKLQAWLALAMVRRGFNEAGAQLESGGQAASVISTPAVEHINPRSLTGG